MSAPPLAPRVGPRRPPPLSVEELRAHAALSLERSQARRRVREPLIPWKWGVAATVLGLAGGAGTVVFDVGRLP